MTAVSSTLLRRYLQGLLAPAEFCQADDRRLLAHFSREGNQAAFRELLRRHGPMVLGLCRRLLRHEQDAEDAFQAVFVILARKAASLRKPNALAAWLHGVAARVALQARARRRRSGSLAAVDEPGAAEQPLERASWGEVRQLLDEELQRLPSRYRDALVLCYLQGRTRDEAAQRLGWSLGTLKRRLERGRCLLHARLLRRGVAPLVLATAALAPEGLTDAVPGPLAETTLRAIAAGDRLPAAIAALTNGVLQAACWSKVKMMVAATALLVVLATGAGLAVPGRNEIKESPQTPSSPSAAAAAKTDRYGDPLPPGASARLGTIQQRVQGWALAWSADGRTIVTCSRKRSLSWWDANTGKLKKRQDWPGREWRRVHLSPNARMLAAEEMDCTLSVWDTATGKRRHSFDGFRWLGDYPFAFSPDGRVLIVGNNDKNDGVLHHFDLVTGKRRILGEHSMVGRLAISPDGQRLASSNIGTIRCWDIASGKEIWQIPQRTLSLRFSPDGRYLAFPDSSKLQLLDATTGKRTGHKTLTEIPYYLQEFAAKGDTFTVAVQDNRRLTLESVLCDGTTGKPRFRMPGYLTCFSPDGKKIAALQGHVLQCWDTVSGKPCYPDTTELGHTLPPTALAYSPDGKLLASAAGYDGSIRLWDVASTRLRHRFSDCFRFSCQLFFSSDGKQLIVMERDTNQVRFDDVATGKEARHLTLRQPRTQPGKPLGGVQRLHRSADGKTLSAVHYAPSGEFMKPGVSTFVRWEGDSGKPLSEPMRVRTNLAPDDSLTFTPDGRLFRIDSHSIRDVSEHDRIFASLTKDDTIGSPYRNEAFQFSEDGAFIAALFWRWKKNGTDNEMAVTGLQIWELATGSPLRRLPVTQFASFSFSADGRLLAAAEADGLRVWDVLTGEEVYHQAVPGHLLNPFGGPLTFAPDGRTLAVGLQDTTITLWDIAGARRAIAPKPELSAKQQESLWNDLRDDEAAKAYAAVAELIARPRQAVALLRQRMPVVAPIATETLHQLINDLDSDSFTVRDAASKRLAELGPQADGALRAALTRQPSLEMRKRIDSLLSVRTALTTEALRGLRAIRVLEQMNTDNARQLLQTLADGAAHARLAKAAEAALRRQKNRRP